jgi:hypothetical protein
VVEVTEEAAARVAEKEEVLISQALPAILQVEIEETILRLNNKRKNFKQSL